jgi:thiol-disulfide isomerase/thioredoxin
MNVRSFFGAAVVALSLALHGAAQSLGIGDLAPNLRVGSWIRGEPVDGFERDRVYVVEFWATWCVPCKRSIPKLTELQGRYAARGVRVIGISVWEDRASDVAPFVEQLGPAMSYTVATDHVLEGAKPEQGSMARAWLRAAGESSIPTAFIIDGGGKIAWIGDTLSIDKPLEQIVAGTWDVQAAKAAQDKRVHLRGLDRKLMQQLKARQHAEALATIDEMQKLSPESEVRTAAWRFLVLLKLERGDEAYAYARKVVDGVLLDEPIQLNYVAWFIVDPEAEKQPKRDLDFALRVAQRANELTESRNPSILDTLALVHFERGEIEQALELQEKAVQLAAEPEWLVAELKARLERFRAAKKPLVSHGRGDGFVLR